MPANGAFVQLDPVSPSPRVLTVRGDSSYATGGYTVVAFDSAVTPTPLLPSGATIMALYDAMNKKVKFITVATQAEVANASDQSAVTVKLLLYN
jgi:hypothetical protein